MDRRQFFRFGIRNLKQSAVKNTPEILRPATLDVRFDVSILTSDPEAADRLAQSILRDHFGSQMLRLRESIVPGNHPCGILVFENDDPLSYQQGVSLFSAAVRSLKAELALSGIHSDPYLLRYTNFTPPMSRTVSLRHGGALLATIPLNEDRSYIFTGTLGPARVAVIDGHFRFERSLCAHQTCVAHPPIIAPGQRITCAPNGLTAFVGLVNR
jgi:hypothetical protein